MLKLLFLLTRRHLLDRPLRTTITMVGVALGVALAVAIRTANVTVLESFEYSVHAVAGRATLQITGGELGLDEAIIQAVRRHPAVESATPVIHQQARLVGGPHDGQPFVIMGLDLLEAADLKSFRIRAEDEERAMDRFLALHTIFVGAGLAGEQHLRVGDSFDVIVGTQRYRVVMAGVIESISPLSAAWDQIGIMDIASAQGLFGLTGRLDRIDIETSSEWSVSTVAEELTAMLPPSVTVSRPARRNEQVERMLRAFQLNLVTLSAVGLLVGLLLVYNTVAFIVAQRRREIGIMRAYGMPRPHVLVLFLIEAAVIGALGGIIGSGLGMLWARTVVSMLARTVSDLYVTVPLESLRDVVRIPMFVFGQGLMLGVAVSIVGAAAPALEASRTAPARAVSPGDYEATRHLNARRLVWMTIGTLVMAAVLSLPGPVMGIPVFGYGAALSLLVGLSCLAPFLVKGLGLSGLSGGRHVLEASRSPARGHLRRVALEHLARAPGRNGVTVSALMIGIAIMLGVGIMIHSFRSTVEAWINQTIMADLIVAPPSWLQGEESGMLARRIPGRWKELVQSVPGVRAVDPYREITVELDGKPRALISRDLRLHATHSRYLFMEGESVELLHDAVAQEGVMVSEPLARSLGFRTGRLLRLRTPSGQRDLRIVGIFYDYATDGGKVVMDRSLYRHLWQDDSATVLAVYLEPSTDARAVRSRIMESVGREGQLIVVSNAELKREILAIFDRTFAITYALELTAVVIGLLGIVNTLLISTLERRRELATLRAIGASAGQIKRLVLWESVYLGVIGAALGTIGGGLLALLLIHVINKQSFGWTIQLAVSGTLLVQATGLALFVSLLAAYWPARWAARQPIADGLRYE